MWGNEVPTGTKSHPETVQPESTPNQLDDDEDICERSVQQSSVGHKSLNVATEAVSEPADTHTSCQDSQQSIQLQNISHVAAAQLNDIDADSPPVANVQLPLSLMEVPPVDTATATTHAQNVHSQFMSSGYASGGERHDIQQFYPIDGTSLSGSVTPTHEASRTNQTGPGMDLCSIVMYAHMA